MQQAHPSQLRIHAGHGQTAFQAQLDKTRLQGLIGMFRVLLYFMQRGRLSRRRHLRHAGAIEFHDECHYGFRKPIDEGFVAGTVGSR